MKIGEDKKEREGRGRKKMSGERIEKREVQGQRNVWGTVDDKKNKEDGKYKNTNIKIKKIVCFWSNPDFF